MGRVICKTKKIKKCMKPYWIFIRIGWGGLIKNLFHGGIDISWKYTIIIIIEIMF